MKTISLLLYIFVGITCFAQTQSEMHKHASEAYKKADLELDRVYQKILVEYRTDSIFIDRLINAQRIWKLYRDAEFEMKFPSENEHVEYGSVYPTCASEFLKEMTEVRLEHLKLWLKGIKEGDMCSGSIKTID